jgi:cyclic beta-1,2-glucan synthetase
MGTTIHSSFDLTSTIPLSEAGTAIQRWTEPAGPEQDRQKLEQLSGALREFLQGKPVSAGGSLKFLEPIWKSAAEQVSFAVKVAQAPPSAQILPDRIVRALSENLSTLKESLAEASAGIEKTEQFPHVEMSGKAVPRPFALACALLQASGFSFEEQTVAKCLVAVQEEVSLEMSELWHLKPMLELVLLGQFAQETRNIAALASRVDSGSAQEIEEPLGRLRAVLNTLTEIAGMEWKLFFDRVCLTEQILRSDPQGSYAKMDDETREAYRSAVADLAKHSSDSEPAIARKAVALARQARQNRAFQGRAGERRSHVGYYLVDDGQAALKTAIEEYRPSLVAHIRDSVLKSPDLTYVLGIEIAAIAIVGILIPIFHVKFSGLFGLALILFPALECAVAIVNALATRLVPPKRVPKLDFSKGIPADCSSVVAVPALLTSEAQVRQAVHALEIRYLANRDRNLHFALLSDLPDSDRQFDRWESLVGLAKNLVRELDAKYAPQGQGRFFLFHRNRKYNAAEGVWMGWERKRGKLLDFNRFLLDEGDEFAVKTGETSRLKNIRYVITLDLDTQLPPGVARKLVGTMAHPLNRAVIDPVKNTVVEGYGILQPRVDISVKSASRSRFASLLSGDTGFDIYTRAVSDVYQDLFGEGIFAGKGIYEVETFQRVLEHRFPCNMILSHDLIEGVYARAGLVSDVEIVDDYPSHFSAFSRRKHRWVRGDWQIVFSLLPKHQDNSGRMVFNPLSYISRWKVFDNLRRSLTDFAVMLLLFYGWMHSPNEALRWTAAVLALVLFPVCFQPLFSLLTAGKAWFQLDFWQGLGRDFAATLARVCVRLAFLCHQSFIDVDAVVRSVVRMKFTHRKLLEWETAAEAEVENGGDNVVDAYLKYSLLITIVMGPLVYFLHPGSFSVALPFLVLWAGSAWIGEWLNQPQQAPASRIKACDRGMVRNAALGTWRFFQEFSNPAENWLIPDFVEEVSGRFAHRISPTNLGLLLNARLAAHDLGYLTTCEFVRDTERTIETVRAMRKWRGHLYNWYQTESLEPDLPLFVSTVDNGNFACSLWTLKQGCLEMIQKPLFDSALRMGLRDVAVQFAEAAIKQDAGGDLTAMALDLKARAEKIASENSLQVSELRALEVEALGAFNKAIKGKSDDHLIWWARELEARAMNILAFVERFAPWLGAHGEPGSSAVSHEILRRHEKLTLESLPRVYREVAAKLETDGLPNSAHEAPAHMVAALRKSAQLAEELVSRLRSLASIADGLVEAMDFSLLFDERKKLFSIGYEDPAPAISKYNYDQLASEARSAVFVAIAKNEAPFEAWFRLKRSYRKYKNESVLLSWSGTAFEYLMPSLWLRGYPNTLVDRGLRSIVRAQQAFAREHRIPWGVSECACASKTPDGFFVYHAFGVPGLALHRDDHSDDLVVTPYATFLAMMFDVDGAVKNMRKLKELGMVSAYGFYESADFTPKRNEAAGQHTIVRSWMAHHQGMSLLAAANVLCDSAMQRRFHAEPRVAAMERLLHERQPRALPYEALSEAMEREPSSAAADSVAVRPLFPNLVPKAL